MKQLREIGASVPLEDLMPGMRFLGDERSPANQCHASLMTNTVYLHVSVLYKDLQRCRWIRPQTPRCPHTPPP